jgi:ureidoglycolate hydrolase
MTEIRLELTEATQLQDIIEFAELAKRYGDKTHREIVQPTEGNRHRMMLVFETQHSKINTGKAKRDLKVAEYIDPIERKRRADLMLRKNSDKHRTIHHTERHR